MQTQHTLGMMGNLFVIAGAMAYLRSCLAPVLKVHTNIQASDVFALFAVADFLWVVDNILTHNITVWTWIDLALGLITAWLWWTNRRKGKGKKALKTLGDKSRAMIRVMVRQMTPSPIPSPVRS